MKPVENICSLQYSNLKFTCGTNTDYELKESDFKINSGVSMAYIIAALKQITTSGFQI